MKKIVFSLLAFSTFAFASATPNPGGITFITPGGNQGDVGAGLLRVVGTAQTLANAIYGTLFVIALIIFFVGIFRFFFSKEADAHKKGYQYMGFGIIAILVMTAIWGIIAFILANTGIGAGGTGDGLVPGAPGACPPGQTSTTIGGARVCVATQ